MSPVPRGHPPYDRGQDTRNWRYMREARYLLVAATGLMIALTGLVAALVNRG